MYTLNFDNRRVVVLGAGSGIGEAIAGAFAETGAHLAMSYVAGETGAHEIGRTIEAAGRRASVISVDSQDIAQVRAFVDEAFTVLGAPDIFVYNAGITEPHAALDMTEDEWDRTLDINLKAMFFFSQRAAQRLRESDRPAVIVLISSVHSVGALPGHAHYAASKAAINQLTRVLALELAPAIRVNAIAPGVIYTERARRERLYDPDDMAAHIVLNRVGTPTDIAQCALFLASPCASYITGQTIFVDGGLLLPMGLPGAPHRGTED
jgi:NAD(P)-dependent dehydrogenase (short-subunit alcohol dehydrogenase family)